jgi:hypothetical protein
MLDLFYSNKNMLEMSDLRQSAVSHSIKPPPVMASGGSAGFNRSNAARNRDTSTKLRTLNPACRPPFSQWEKGWG